MKHLASILEGSIALTSLRAGGVRTGEAASAETRLTTQPTGMLGVWLWEVAVGVTHDRNSDDVTSVLASLYSSSHPSIPLLLFYPHVLPREDRRLLAHFLTFYP